MKNKMCSLQKRGETFEDFIDNLTQMVGRQIWEPGPEGYQ